MNQSGLSLIELAVVIFIMGIVVSVARSEYRKFQLRSKQAEALTILRAMNQHLVEYENNNGSLTSSDCQSVSFDDSLDEDDRVYECLLVNNGQNISNPLGASILNPDKSHYNYSYKSEVQGSVVTWMLIASSRENFMFCPQKGLDRYYVNHCGKICHFQTIDLKTCTSKNTACGSEFNCSN